MKYTLKALMLTLVFLTASTAYSKTDTSLPVAPVPNLMPMIMHHGEMLNLDEKQQAKLAEWRKKQHHKMHKLGEEIRADQAAILEAALNGKPADEILAMEEAVEEKRVKFITTKTACRDNMKKLLTAEQWNQVIDIYKKENGLK